MTTQEKLQAITDNIRQKLPRLMELEEGCLVMVKHNDFISYEAKVIETGGGGQIADTGGYDDSYIFLNSHFEGYEQRHADDEDIEIIGKEPMLTDVLEWLQLLPNLLERNEDLFLYIEGIFCIYDSGWNKFNYTKVCWDLTKPYLKDQSEKVINFLYNFIENE